MSVAITENSDTGVPVFTPDNEADVGLGASVTS